MLKALFRLNKNPSDVLSSWHKEGTACKANSRGIASILSLSPIYNVTKQKLSSKEHLKHEGKQAAVK
ncbi:hypothetical protein OUZ56_022504 [Daphnia magna]|uniref:Uncharacterized protein n=1 Tax=Daphnia magna TaxID=35525 RepID=A0ABR0AXA7_9CRUS|nr:hypothetical protein OUZ56_022504 [Daphnia magna]